MNYANELKGCRVIIRDIADDQIVADTKILAFDSYRNSLRIGASSVNRYGKKSVSVLILNRNGLIYEYAGTMRNAVIANEVEISLGAGRSKEDRKKARYKIETRGEVEAVILEGQTVFLHKPIEISTKNISANGILLETMSGSFEIGNRILLNFKLGESILKNRYEVIRVQNSNLCTEQYGCVLLSEKKIR